MRLTLLGSMLLLLTLLNAPRILAGVGVGVNVPELRYQ